MHLNQVLVLANRSMCVSIDGRWVAAINGKLFHPCTICTVCGGLCGKVYCSHRSWHCSVSVSVFDEFYFITAVPVRPSQLTISNLLQPWIVVCMGGDLVAAMGGEVFQPSIPRCVTAIIVKQN